MLLLSLCAVTSRGCSLCFFFVDAVLTHLGRKYVDQSLIVSAVLFAI